MSETHRGLFDYIEEYLLGDTTPEPPSPTTILPQIRIDLLQLHNIARSNRGIHPLTMNSLLNRCSQKYVKKLASVDKIGRRVNLHSIDGTFFYDRILAEGYNYQHCSENAAGGQQTFLEAFKDWMHSSVGHKDTILNPQYKDVGFGAYSSATGRWFWIACFGAL